MHTWVISSEANCFKIVVLPALSRPSNRILTSFSGAALNLRRRASRPWKYNKNHNDIGSELKNVSSIVLKPSLSIWQRAETVIHSLKRQVHMSPSYSNVFLHRQQSTISCYGNVWPNNLLVSSAQNKISGLRAESALWNEVKCEILMYPTLTIMFRMGYRPSTPEIWHRINQGQSKYQRFWLFFTGLWVKID